MIYSSSPPPLATLYISIFCATVGTFSARTTAFSLTFSRISHAFNREIQKVYASQSAK